MTNKLNKNEKGFALPLTLLLLVVMTIMGATLITVITGEHKANTDKDTSQQVFYAAESGIAIAKKWMATETSTLESASQTARDGSLKFCKTTLFPNLKDNSNSLHSGTNTLSNVITGASREEKERLGKYSFEYFIAYSPDANGNNSSPKKKSGTNNSLYTIYSCGCNEAKDSCNAKSNVIVPIEAVVTLVN